MPWTELAVSRVNGTDLALYRDEAGTYMIRADDLELMNGRNHASEDRLGAMAGSLARRRADPRLLIGGLGLGYTLAAAATALGSAGEITVAEISPDVIDWYQRYFAPALFPVRPENLRLVAADVATILLPASYDVIVLDVDNGPRALTSESNDHLYSAAGLTALHGALREDGVLLVWSGFEAPDFAARAKSAGFSADSETVAIPDRPGLFHYIYRLTKA